MKRNLSDTSTIAAAATPPGSGGVGIIRISGSGSLAILKKIFRPSSSCLMSSGEYDSHKMYHGRIINPDNAEFIDEVLAVFMKGPKSFTAEDVVEIQGHGGSYLTGATLSIVLDNGARMAEPGEFTMRAFLNGRIDLTQAEGVLDVIEASSSEALKLAANQLGGGLGNRIEAIRESLRHIHAGFDAVIDFPDETEDSIEISSLVHEMEYSILPVMKALFRTYEETRFLREGVRLVMAGPPNAGKSSLMNALTGEERSIVTSVPGTTRDLVRERLSLAGSPVLLTDTAGLRDSEDEIESIGISLAKRAISDSDMVLWILDITEGIDETMAEAIKNRHVRHGIIVWNKSDLDGHRLHSEQSRITSCDSLPEIKVSAKTGEGIEDLKKLISELLFSSASAEKSPVAINLRHRNLLEKAILSTGNAIAILKNTGSVELGAEDLREAVSALDSILGENLQPDILDEIFSRFCIGK